MRIVSLTKLIAVFPIKLVLERLDLDEFSS